MLLPDALVLTSRLIETGETHCDYERVKDLAETYRIYITGCDIGKKLIQFVQREDKELFAQRLRLTKSITPAVASSIRQPFNKVTRNDRVKKDIKIKDEARKQNVDKMIKSFYGSARKKNRGLDYWMKTRFVELQFIDPNSWVVVEWEAAQSDNQIVQPRPFEVCAEEAVNFLVINDEVKWLLVKQAIKYMLMPDNDAAGVTGGINQQYQAAAPQQDIKAACKKDGYRYTLYDMDVTVVYEQVDPQYLKVSGYQLKEGEQLTQIKANWYIVRTYTPKVGYAPVFRIGYKRDDATKARTFVNPWHDALCYFDKSLKTVSELDLTQTLHTFPQKIQYVQKCKGPTREKKCNQGQLADGSICTACKGNGYKIHTTAQDAILLPMPDSKDDMMDLDKLLVYKAPPIELIKFQNDYTQQLERQAHQAVFNSQVFIKKTSSGGDGQNFQTATENDNNMQSVYDALEPFTEKFSEIWQDFAMTFAILAGANPEEVETTHVFPADPKLKTGDILLVERKAATDSGAPAFLLASIDDDLATIVFAGDDLGMLRYRVKRRYYPFPGSTPDEIAQLVTSQWVPEEPKVLYSNFDAIFKEIELADPGFWTMKDPNKQREVVDAKVKEYIGRLKQQAPTITQNDLRNTNPVNGGTDGGGDGNPGNNNPTDGGSGNN
jgi:hypothetical protein